MADIKAQDPAAIFPYPKVKTKKTIHPIKTPSPAVTSLSHICHPDLESAITLNSQPLSPAAEMVLYKIPTQPVARRWQLEP